jgi:ABC-type glycerol-3-phosphate transport system permease component
VTNTSHQKKGMFEPVEINDILISVMAGALVVMFGALYALAFAIGRLHGSRIIVRLAYLFFAMLVVSALTLAATLHLTGIWQIVTAVILAGYLLAPHAIWKLCVGTHPDRPVGRPANDRSYS